MLIDFMKYFNYIFLIIVILPISYGTYISQINFLDDEFVEIYSVQSLNLSNATIQDENIGFNSLSLIKKANSNFSLIVGTKFISQNNLPNLNCNIYSTGLTSPGKYGLRDTGENILINISNSVHINFTKSKNYLFQINESLNYNISNNSYFIAKKSPCRSLNISSFVNLSSNTLNLNLTQNQSNLVQNISNNLINQTNATILNSTNYCDYSFQINPLQNLTSSKIEFSFNTNASNFTIEYWVEDYENNIVKNKINTTNKNKKTYTPKDYTNVYKIKSNLFSKNCNKNDSKLITFYSKSNSYLKSIWTNSKNTLKTNSNPQSSSTTQSIPNQIQNKNSYIKILNKNDIINNKTNYLEYEVYKGDTLKRSIYFFHNNNKINSFQLKKYETKKGKFYFNETFGLNILKINGLGIGEKLEFKSLIKTNNNFSNKKDYFNITNLIIKNNKVNFSIDSNIDEIEFYCYILNKKTKVSSQINNSNFLQNLSLEINQSKLKKSDKITLKLLCKYKKNSNKYFKYVSKLFNLSKESIVYLSKPIFEIVNLSTKKNTNLETIYLGSSNKILTEFNYEKLINPKINVLQKEKSKQIYSSSESKNKESSIILILIGLSSILSTLIFLW